MLQGHSHSLHVAHVLHDLIIHEMLRKKDKATQHSSPKAVIFKEKYAGGIRTHDYPLARCHSYQLSYQGMYACI